MNTEVHDLRLWNQIYTLTESIIRVQWMCVSGCISCLRSASLHCGPACSYRRSTTPPLCSQERCHQQYSDSGLCRIECFCVCICSKTETVLLICQVEGCDHPALFSSSFTSCLHWISDDPLREGAPYRCNVRHHHQSPLSEYGVLNFSIIIFWLIPSVECLLEKIGNGGR